MRSVLVGLLLVTFGGVGLGLGLVGCSSSDPPAPPSESGDALSKTPSGSKASDPKAGKTCGGPDRLPCDDGYICDMGAPAKEGEPEPMGKCTKDDGPEPPDTIAN
jgi:hypothetical protein